MTPPPTVKKKVSFATLAPVEPPRSPCWHSPTEEQMAKREEIVNLSRQAEKLHRENGEFFLLCFERRSSTLLTAIAADQAEALYHARRALDREQRRLWSFTEPSPSSRVISPMSMAEGVDSDQVTTTMNLLQQLSLHQIEQERYILPNQRADTRQQCRLEDTRLEREKEERRERDQQVARQMEEIARANAERRHALVNALPDLRREIRYGRSPHRYNYSSPPMFGPPR